MNYARATSGTQRGGHCRLQNNCNTGKELVDNDERPHGRRNANFIGCGGWTNTITASGELTFTGKWAVFRAVVTQPTNSVLKVVQMAE